ncbi:MAG: nuclear transport factor 2 family protein [Chitinophagales bacterium]|nr:nuclear transport factor 2 family protein [Chitinophagales bacterium]
MTIQEIAKRFEELTQQGRWDLIQDELFADNARSIEPSHSNWPPAEGIAAIKEKGKKWNEMVEQLHGGFCTPPVIGGNFFSVGMGMDVTIKGQGRINMDEIAVYEVKDGKIVLEQFFY